MSRTPGRSHWLIASEGWQEVAQACIYRIGSLRRVESGRGVDEVEGSAGEEEEPMALSDQVPAGAASPAP